MIAAVTKSGLTIEIEDTGTYGVIVRNLGRANLSIGYVGGIGDIPTKRMVINREEIEAAATIDDEAEEALENWQEAMNDTDRLADYCSASTAAALRIEEEARKRFVSLLEKK